MTLGFRQYLRLITPTRNPQHARVRQWTRRSALPLFVSTRLQEVCLIGSWADKPDPS